MPKSTGGCDICVFSVRVFSSLNPPFPPLLLSIFLSASSSYIKSSCEHTQTKERTYRHATDTTDSYRSPKTEQRQPRRALSFIMHDVFVYVRLWICSRGSSFVLSCVHSLESICPQQRSSGGMKWKSSVGQCENIHTHAGVELTQHGVSKWAAFMLTPEAAAVCVHLQLSFLLLIGKMTPVCVALCFHMEGSKEGGPRTWILTRCVCVRRKRRKCFSLSVSIT